MAGYEWFILITICLRFNPKNLLLNSSKDLGQHISSIDKQITARHIS